MAGKFYLTTPIYYPSDKLHIGHAYTTVAADALARWHRFRGEDVFFLTGSDEHGQKIERIARERGATPKEYVDRIVATFKELWARLEISYDDFIRTTEPRHHRVVQEVFRRIYEKGDIYKGTYEGWYCTPCETFWPESRLVEGKCPDCGRPVELLREESYFFRLSKYADRILQHIEENPDFIQPASRRNEMIAFINSGLEDLSVSRTTFDWGIPVPVDEGHVIYVWFDALTNYLTGVGFLEDEEKFRRYWPADLHLVGKEIVRFHTIIWPIILMAADLPLPKQVFGHGWLLFDRDKMSKSKGNVVDPYALMDEFGVDPIRYFLLREVSFGQDGNFSRRALIERTNADLANDLGNLVYRSLTMVDRYFDGVVPEPAGDTALDRELKEVARQAAQEADRLIEQLDLNSAIAAIWRFVGRANKYIDQAEPWVLARERKSAPDREARLRTVIYNLAEALRVTALLVKSFIPSTARRIWEQLGLDLGQLEAQRIGELKWGGLRPGLRVNRGEPLFPRIEVESEESEGAEGAEGAGQVAKEAGKEIAKKAATGGIQAAGHPVPAAVPAAGAAAAAVQGGAKPGAAKPVAAKSGGAEPGASKPEASQPNGAAQPAVDGGDGLISIEEFGRVDLRVAEVLAADRIPGADRLLKLQIDVGGERRQIVAGISQHYQPEELVGKRIVVVANLKPARLRGEVSQGMLLAATGPDGRLGLLTVERQIASGAKVK